MIPNLIAKEPSIIPEKTFDKLWVEEIIISAPNPNEDANAMVKLKKFGVFDGVAEFMPTDNGIRLDIENLLAKSAEDQELASIVYSLLLYIKKYGIQKNIISNIE